MFSRIARYSLILFIVGNCTCVLHNDEYNSIKWEKTIKCLIKESRIIQCEDKVYYINDFSISDHLDISVDFSKKRKYAKVPSLVQKKEKDVFSPLGFSIFSIVSDTLKKCDVENTVDLEKVIIDTKKMIKNR